MERETTPTSTSPSLEMLLIAGLTGPEYKDLKSRTESLLNDAFKSIYTPWTGYEISLIPSLTDKGMLNFIVAGNRSRLEHTDKENIPYLYDMIHGNDSIMINAVRIQHRYGLRYAGGMMFMDTKTGLRFRIAAHVNLRMRK